MKNEIFNQSIKYHDKVKRNIIFTSLPGHAFAEIGDDDHDLAVIEIASQLARESVTAKNKLTDFYYSAAIGFPFRTTPFMRTRFSDGTYPVWYGSSSVETSIYETAHHLIRFMQAEEGTMQEKKIIKKRSVFDVFCSAILTDLCAKQELFPKLSAEDYAFSIEVGKQIKEGGIPGILYSSARHIGGKNIGIFQQSVLENPRLLGHLQYIIIPGEKMIRISGLKLKLNIPFMM